MQKQLIKKKSNFSYWNFQVVFTVKSWWVLCSRYNFRILMHKVMYQNKINQKDILIYLFIFKLTCENFFFFNFQSLGRRWTPMKPWFYPFWTNFYKYVVHHIDNIRQCKAQKFWFAHRIIIWLQEPVIQLYTIRHNKFL